MNGRGDFLNKIRKCIRRVFWMYVVMFTCLILSIAFVMLDSSKIKSSFNPRIKKDDPMVMRGEIRDRNGNILAQTVKQDGKFKREYNFDRQFAHIVGYNDMGKSGIELKYNFELNKVKFEIFERIKQIFYNTDLKGNNLILTLDQKVQNKAYELLNKKKGAIVAVEPSTGKIIAMVSYPNFNPNTISENWESLNSDSENSPLINRATQGLYAPGSVFKIVTASAAIENLDNWQNFTNECVGEKMFGDKNIRCYNSKKHGNVNLIEAFAVSCNTSFAMLGTELGADILKIKSEKFGFNNSIKYPLDYSQSKFSLTANSSISELVQTAIGQGKTVTTPLQMERIVSAVANGGILMQPYVVDHIKDNSGRVIQKNIPKKETQMFAPDVANELVNMMIEVVNSGTGKAARIENVVVAGKTGTAEVDGKNPHSWFVGFAPAQSPKIAVTVVLENSGEGGLSAAPIAREIINTALNELLQAKN